MAKVPPDSPYGRLHRIYDQEFASDVERNLDALMAIRELRKDLSEAEDHAALTARRQGATWQQIGEALGMSRQAAHERWGNIARFAGWDD